MMTEDGVPKVTDFGLAKLIGDEGQEQTRTGEILGTPGYLAPEQARGERSVGPPADIHALGAILYFLLTGRPPFVGTTPVETVRQVMIEDPLPPSKLQPKLNRELETICLTCMQKEPEKRYASAQDLADELQRVLDGTPILARPITRAERLWKWCKRNPRVATLSGLAATLLLILLCGGYISAGVINRQRLAESEARTEAEANELIAKENEALAEDQADLALDATRVVLYQTQQFFRYKPELTVLRKSMLDGILPEIERIYSVDTRYDVKEKFRASTLKQLGEIYFEAGAYENALERFKESEAIALDLHGQGRLSRSELNLGTLDHLIGDAQLKLGNLDLAEKRYLSMIEHRKRYLAAQPRIQENAKKQSMAEAYGRLGEVYGLQGRVAEAMPLLQQSLDTRRTWYESNPRDLRTGEELAGALGQLSSLYEQSGQHDEMIAASEQALTLLRNSAANKTDFPTVFNLARGLRQLGRQYLVVDRIQEAEECLQESVTNYERALDDTPDYGLAQSQAADAHYLLAQILFRSGREHGQQCRRGIELCGLLLEKSRNTANQVMKLKLVALSGDVEEATRLADEFVGQSNNAFRCLCGAIAYSFSAEHSEEPQRQQLIDKALDLVKIAVVDLKFGDVGVLRNDPDFGPLRRVPEFEQLLSAAESK
jgi:tetratricopeptide (TPR) repeat protein